MRLYQGFIGHSVARTEGNCFQVHPCLLWLITARINPWTVALEVPQGLLQEAHEAIYALKVCRLNK